MDIYLETVNIYSEMWIYIPKFGHIFLNVDKYSKLWTYTRNVDTMLKSGQNHTKVDKILENDTFDLSKLGIGYSVGSTMIVSISLASTAYNQGMLQIDC